MCPPSSSLHQLRLKAVFPCSRPPAAAIHVRSEAKKRGSRMPRLLCIGKRSCARVPLLSMSRASSHYLNSPCLSGVTTGVTPAAPQGSPSPLHLCSCQCRFRSPGRLALRLSGFPAQSARERRTATCASTKPANSQLSEDPGIG